MSFELFKVDSVHISLEIFKRLFKNEKKVARRKVYRSHFGKAMRGYFKLKGKER